MLLLCKTKNAGIFIALFVFDIWGEIGIFGPSSYICRLSYKLNIYNNMKRLKQILTQHFMWNPVQNLDAKHILCEQKTLNQKLL